MAALSKRDIEMVFRAETDAAQRPVDALTGDIKKLRQTLDELTKASGKTDKSLDSLADTTRELEKAQSELSNARTLLTQLNSQASALERAEEAAEKASKRYSELKAQVDGAEAPTKRLTNSLAAAERALAANNARVAEQRKNYSDVKTSIEGIIGPVDNLQDAFKTVAIAQREVTQGLAAAKGSAAGFKAEIADTKLELDRLAQVDAFRKIAADSMAADSAAERIKSGLDGGTTSAQRLVDAVQALVNPAAAAATTIGGMDERLEGVIAKMAGGKLNISEWSYLNNELQSVQASLISVSAEIDKFTAQQARVDDAARAYDLQAAKVRELAAAEVTASTSVEQLTADLQREEGALNKSAAALDRETAKLREMGTALQRVGVDSNQLPQAIARIEASARKAAPALQEVSNKITPGGKKGFLGLDVYQLQNLSYQVNDVFTSLGSGAPPMQVLAQQGGQILQIFPGILSTFARFLPIIGPLAVGFTVLAGAIGEANTAIEQTREAQATLASLGDNNGFDVSQYKAIIALHREIGATAEEAAKSTKILVESGVNPAFAEDLTIAATNLVAVRPEIGDTADAMKLLTEAFTGGADEVLKLDDQLHFLSDTQRDQLVLSKDTKDEYNEVNKAFTALYQKMQDGAALSKGPMTDAANTLRGAWRGLLNTFADTGIIESVTKWLSDAVLGFAVLVNVAKRSVALFKGAGTAYDMMGGGMMGTVAAAAVIAKNIGSGGASDIISGAKADTVRQMGSARQAIIAEQRGRGDIGEGSSGRQKDEEAQAKKDRKDAERDAKRGARSAESEAKRRQREAEQLAKQYENEQDQLAANLSRVTATAMKGQQAPLQAQLELAKQAVDEQFKAMEDRLSEFGAKFGKDAKINGMTQAEYAASLAAQKQQIVLAKQLGVYEENTNDLVKARTDRLKAISEQQKTGLISAQEALDKTREVTSDLGPQIDAAVTAARQFISTLTPSAETQAMLDKFDLIQSRGGTDGGDSGTAIRKQAQSGLGDEEAKINALFERRALLIAAANKLYDLGAINFTDKEARIKAAYETTNGAITNQIAAMKEYLLANEGLFPPEMFQAALASLEEFNTQLTYTDTLTQTLKTTAESGIAQGFTQAFDTLAQGIANVLVGAGSLKDLFSDLGRAALNFAAQFTKAIADAIIQVYALRIAKSLIGGFHGGGTVGDYSGGQMKLSRGLGFPDLSGVPRYHNGTQGAGLKSNEMLAVLEKGEKVTTKEQQRLENNRLKAASKGRGGTGLRQVLAFGDNEIAAAMQGSAGERTTVTHIRRNAPMIKQLLKD